MFRPGLSWMVVAVGYCLEALAWCGLSDKGRKGRAWRLYGGARHAADRLG